MRRGPLLPASLTQGKVLKSFVVLKAVTGSPATTRAFNAAGPIVWRAMFVDGSPAIVVTQAPQAGGSHSIHCGDNSTAPAVAPAPNTPPPMLSGA